MPEKRGLPLRKNQEIELEVERFGADAVGVCHWGEGGFAVFAPGALPGERIAARIVKVEKRHAFAQLLQVLRPSPDRVAPPCPVYRRCGCCSAQHMTYGRSLAFKREQVRDCLERIGGFASNAECGMRPRPATPATLSTPSVLSAPSVPSVPPAPSMLSAPPTRSTLSVPPVLGMAEPWHYRNKGAFPVAGEPGAPKLGFYAPRSHAVIDAPMGCLVQHPSANAAVAAVRAWMIRHRVAPYDETTHAGILRHVVTRTMRDGRTMVTLVAREAPLPAQAPLIAALREAVPGLASVALSRNARPGNVILGETARVLWGADALEETLCGMRFRVSPHSFFQINAEQAEALYAQALAYAGLTGSETVVDVYCGAGTITLALAAQARRVVGIEVTPQAVADARINARINGIDNVEFLAGEAEHVLPELVARGFAPDVVVVDPPRKGCDPAVLGAVARAAPKRVVYVSCNPATLARDAALLATHGYAAAAVQPFDMFCWAGDVETAMLLERT
jgi:23S rRNA (uracil1939-C5)-methyltransferase